MNSKLKVKGIFQFKAYKGDQVVHEYIGKNLVVDLGLEQITKLLAGDGSNRHIASISFGTDGTTPQASDTAITGPFNKAIDGFSYPATGRVKFDWSLDETENNGMVIAEFGLMTQNGDLFARKTHSPITKDSDIRLEGSWTIIF